MSDPALASPAVICLSGGMDSTSLMLRMLREGASVYGIAFDYGQKHRHELQRLQQNIDYLNSGGLPASLEHVRFPELGTLFHSALTNGDWEVPLGHYADDNMKQTVVPNRNAIFISIAYGYALSIATRADTQVQLCLGVHSGDHTIYPDCRPEFYRSIFDAFTVGNWDSERVELQLPYLNEDKYTILKDALVSTEALGLDFDTVFRNTLTSYQPDEQGRSHGQTGSDVERILAFHKLGRVDPIEYTVPWETAVENALRWENKSS